MGVVSGSIVTGSVRASSVEGSEKAVSVVCTSILTSGAVDSDTGDAGACPHPASRAVRQMIAIPRFCFFIPGTSVSFSMSNIEDNPGNGKPAFYFFFCRIFRKITAPTMNTTRPMAMIVFSSIQCASFLFSVGTAGQEGGECERGAGSCRLRQKDRLSPWSSLYLASFRFLTCSK